MKIRKVLSVLFVFSMLTLSLSIGAFAAETAPDAATPAAPADGAPADGAPAAATAFTYDESVSAQLKEFTNLTITAVEYADSAATDSQKFSSITKIAYEGGEIAVDSAKYTAIMSVDGTQVDIKPGTYTGKVAIELVNKMGSASGFSKFDNAHVTMTFYPAAAAVVANNKFIKGYSAVAALKAGTLTDTASTGAVIDSDGSFFSGYYITGSKFEIDGLKMSLMGYGGDDFQGWGAGLVVTDKSEVTLKNSIFETKGVIRTAIWVGGDSSKLHASDVVVAAYNDDAAVAYSLEDNYAVPMMEKVPFALGLAGNIRATNVLGSGSADYTNSIIVSNVWGALSTDSGKAGTLALNVTNTLAGIGSLEPVQEGKTYTATKTVGSVNYGFTVGTPETKSSGYVTYADAGVSDQFSGVSFYAPDYIGIIASGTSNMHFDKDCYGYSGRVGFLIHQNNGNAENGGGLYLTGGKYDVADQFIVVKGGAINGSYTTTNVNVDGSEVNLTGTSAQSGVFFQLMQSDDAGSPGATEYTINDPSYTDILNAATPSKTVADTTGTFANMTINGDIYNSVSGVVQGLDVTLDKVVMNGAVSSSYQYHVSETGEPINNTTLKSITSFAKDWNTDYRAIGRIVNVATPAVNNSMKLTLKNGTVWTVDGTCYLSSLTIDETSSVKAAGGDLLVTVDGKEVTLAPGTYTGKIVVSDGPVPVGFFDVADDAWYYNNVMALAEKGVVSGYPNGTYLPENQVTYGEALKLVVKAAGLPDQTATGSHWASGYLTLAATMGIFDANTNLSAPITRAEVAKLAATVLKYTATGASPFADTDDVYATALYESHIIDGYLAADGTRTFKPDATIKRSELAKIVYIVMGLDKAAETAAPADTTAPAETAAPADAEAPADTEAPADAAAPDAPAPAAG